MAWVMPSDRFTAGDSPTTLPFPAPVTVGAGHAPGYGTFGTQVPSAMSTPSGHSTGSVPAMTGLPSRPRCPAGAGTTSSLLPAQQPGQIDNGRSNGLGLAVAG